MLNTIRFLIAALSMTCALAAQSAAQSAIPPGNVYVQTNDPAGNSVLVWNRMRDGTLRFQARYSTGGMGGGPLNSQGSVILTPDERFLLVTNAGDCSLSSFALNVRGGLVLIDKRLTGGDGPISVTTFQGTVYTLHSGSAINDVRGLTLAVDGKLGALPFSRQPLSLPKPGPAQVQFSPQGQWLVVTEKGTNNILIFDVDPMTGLLPSVANVHPSSGPTPFGFGFLGNNRLVVAEAWMGASGAGAVSSYQINSSANLATISASIPSMQTASCWIALTGDGNFAYATNTPDDTITGYSIDAAGVLTRLDASGITGSVSAGANPVDADFSRNSRYLYTCNNGDGSIGAFARQSDGSLIALPSAPSGMPGIWGMAVR